MTLKIPCIMHAMQMPCVDVELLSAVVLGTLETTIVEQCTAGLAEFPLSANVVQQQPGRFRRHYHLDGSGRSRFRSRYCLVFPCLIFVSILMSLPLSPLLISIV